MWHFDMDPDPTFYAHADPENPFFVARKMKQNSFQSSYILFKIYQTQQQYERNGEG